MKGGNPERRQQGRGATLSPDNRYSAVTRAEVDDGWGSLDAPLEPMVTTLTVDASRSVISYNTSPDVGFDRSINPYRGCEHGCVYCFARPTHAYLDLSPGLDFESRLFYKPDAPELLRKELAAARYECAAIAVGINTDAYQPVERRLALTRGILEVLLEARHPFSIVTKSALIERDLDLLAEAARLNLAGVAVSVTTLRRDLARRMEPRAAAPQRRLEVIRALSAAGVPVTVLVAPLIPVLTDTELEDILGLAREAGARAAGYVLLRLPHELKDMFRDWLAAQEPLKAAHVMSRLQDTRGGKDYQSEFGTRMRGTGEYAVMIAQRFRLHTKKLGYGEMPELDCAQFRKPAAGPQMALF
ncbi:MAG: PA0069 family radical SAM protein [Gammaproteobacteria bacterium]|nr:PA0069 family radical SAM protein [Gammaproteobacteria bacterium]